MTSKPRHRSLRKAAISALAVALAVVAGNAALAEQEDIDADREAGRAAFAIVYEVFAHPRCVNCHPVGDRPLQTDRGVPHSMNVARGPDGKGNPGMRCASCHQQQPLPGTHMPPGVPVVEPFPEWSLAPIEMAIQGRSPGELCRQLKDPKQTGGLKLQDIIFHLDEDPLVLWAFEPGVARTPIRIPHDEFMRAASQWADAGAPCPE